MIVDYDLVKIFEGMMDVPQEVDQSEKWKPKYVLRL